MQRHELHVVEILKGIVFIRKAFYNYDKYSERTAASESKWVTGESKALPRCSCPHICNQNKYYERLLPIVALEIFMRDILTERVVGKKVPTTLFLPITHSFPSFKSQHSLR